MAQFLLTVFHDPGVHAAGAAYASEEDMQQAFARVAEFNSQLQASGQFVYACGLTPPESAFRISPEGTRTEGPAGSGSFVGGFWVIEASSTSEAEHIASRGAAACGQPLEVRQLQGEG